MIQASVFCFVLDVAVKPSGNAVLPYQRSVMRVADNTGGGAISIFRWKLCVCVCEEKILCTRLGVLFWERAVKLKV